MSNKGQFKKGNIPWNKGKRGYMGANRTSFTSKRVEQERTKYKLGEAQKPDKRDGWLSCRVEERVAHKDSRTGKIYYHRKRISYCRNLLKSMGIDVPKGYVVYHKDGNISNNDIGNLEVISRAELIKRNKRR
ncbi:MAG: HNH endonuclease [Clostridia bacterium]|nr:HNH endonuclease [Clostridia bacterium]